MTNRNTRTINRIIAGHTYTPEWLDGMEDDREKQVLRQKKTKKKKDKKNENKQAGTINLNTTNENLR
jgi:hypothetical protein